VGVLYLFNININEMKERQFKVGDRVRIASSSQFAEQCSKPGTIKEEKDSDGWFKVTFDNDYSNKYRSQDLLHDPDMTPLFYVGDKIQITQGSGHWVDDMDQYVGQEATITKVEEGYMIDRLYRIDIDKGQWKWIAEAGHFIHAPQKGIDQKDELLHRAKQMYPVGTKFCPAHQADEFEIEENTHCIITDDTSIEFDENGDIVAMVGSQRWFTIEEKQYGNTPYDRIVYYALHKKWAHVYPAKEEPIPATALLLIEAKKRYPIGTKYKNATDGREEFTVTNQSFTVVSADTIHGEIGAGCLMYAGKWAEIVKDTHKFSLGDWVIANSKANERYAVTTEGWSGQVTKVRDDGHISVKGKYNDDNDEYHDLDPDRFDLTTESKIMELTGNVEAPTVHKYKVGDILHLIESCHAVTPQKVTVSALSTRHGRPAYRLSGWSGDFPEDILVMKLEFKASTSDYLQQQMDKVSASIDLSHEKLRVYSSGSIGLSIPAVQPQVRVKKVSFNRI
jgi:hypothetical protein